MNNMNSITQLHLLESTDMREIPLSRGLVTLVDAADYEWLNQWTWHPHNSVKIYAIRKWSGMHMLMHRQIMNAPKGIEVDHINGNSLDNRRSNLRLCTRSQNSINVSKKNIKTSSQFKGIYLEPPHGWRAQIFVNKKRLFLGYFATEIEAAQAYDDAARKYFGEFARLNFPLPGERSALAVSRD